MGACNFYCKSTGKTANEAFLKAVSDAQYDHGHAGYTGTIAEKDEFVMIERDVTVSAEAQAQFLIEGGDERIDDKWGPAGCFDLGNGTFAFFGWVSS